MKAMQVSFMPRMTPQQSTVLPATVATGAQQFDINSIMSMMLPMIIIVMMMGMMGKATEGIGA